MHNFKGMNIMQCINFERISTVSNTTIIFAFLLLACIRVFLHTVPILFLFYSFENSDL